MDPETSSVLAFKRAGSKFLGEDNKLQKNINIPEEYFTALTSMKKYHKIFGE